MAKKKSDTMFFLLMVPLLGVTALNLLSGQRPQVGDECNTGTAPIDIGNGVSLCCSGQCEPGAPGCLGVYEVCQ